MRRFKNIGQTGTGEQALAQRSRTRSAYSKYRHSSPRCAPGLEQLEGRVTPSLLGVFELDGNVTTGVLGTKGSTTTSHDWDQVFADNNVVPPPESGAVASAFVTDAVNSRGDDIFTGGGSKDTLGIQNGPWLFTDSKPQAKDDITHAYAAMYTDPSNGHAILYAGLDRYDNSGDATAGFWFFRDNITESAIVSGNGTGRFIGTHSDGDVLLVSDFTTGGSVSTIKVFVWVGDDATGHLEALPEIPNTTFAVVNGGPISVPWSYTNKSGASQPAAGELLEGGVDLTALGLSGCFASFLAETRSSQSPTATLSDFVVGSFPVCSLAAPQFTDLSKVGDSVTYPLTVQNTGAMPLFIQSVTDTLLGNIVVGHVLRQPGNTGVNPFVTAITSTFDFTQPLAPGASLTIFVSRTVQATDPDPTVNTVTFTGTDDLAGLEDPITASATDSVNLFQPSATMTVTANPTTATFLGQVITYTFTVNNTSSIDSPNLVLSTSNSNNSFTDTLLGNLEATAIANGGGSVAPGGSFNFQVTRPIQAGDPTPLVNSATVAFTLAQNLGAFDNIITAQASSSVTLLPHLEITKVVTDGVDVIHPGDTASFTITVSNTGAGPATNVVVTDQLPAADLLTWGVASSTFGTTSISTGDFLTANSATLAAGATATITVSAVIPADLFGVPSAGGTGNLPDGPFELDGNALVDGAGDDWENAVFGDGGSAFAHSFVTDAFNSQSDDIFTGGGSKDTLGIQNGPWLFTDSKPQAKNDITHAYAAMYTDPSNGHVILYTGLDRFDNSGDATVGFWFFQNSVGLSTSNPTSSGSPFTGTHADGDILLVSDFTVGGSTSTIKVFRWTGNDSTGSLVPVVTPIGTTVAKVNGATIDVPWTFMDKSHHSDPAAGEFFEGGVDLTALGLGSCFANFLAETRSSQSPTATLSDFVIGSFNTCRLDLPNTATVTATNPNVTLTTNEVIITVLDGDDALEAESAGSGAVTDGLSVEQVQTAVAQAVNQWRAAGVDPQSLSNLENITVHVGNLPRAELGFAVPGEIWIDGTAAGWGWSVNGTAGGMDLATVVSHELGHVLGFEHSDTGVMEATLAPGVQRIPEAVPGAGSVVASTAVPGGSSVSAGFPSSVGVAQFTVPLLTLGHTGNSEVALATGVRAGVMPLALSSTTAVDAVFAAVRGNTAPPTTSGVPFNAALWAATILPTTATPSVAVSVGTQRAGTSDTVPGVRPPDLHTMSGNGAALDDRVSESVDALAWQRASAACFVDDSSAEGPAENAAPALNSAAVALALALGGWWSVRPTETESRQRQRFLIESP